MDLSKLLLSFDGRINRQPYWLYILAVIIVVGVPLSLFFEPDTESYNLASAVASLILLYPSLAVQAKRWHDRDKSAWWLLINLIPIVGGLWALIECGFLRGTTGPNRFGPDPLDSPTPERPPVRPA
jgi:uncharacterized membrane protein YhaH (DUF805 family)